MKKFLAVLLALMIMVITAGCGSDKNGRNPDYEYGTYVDGIETVFELTGDVSKEITSAFDQDKGFSSSVVVKISETATGGVVAFAEGKYVYSSQASDVKDIKNELIAELFYRNN